MNIFKTAFDRINDRIQTAINNGTCKIQINNVEYMVSKFDWFASDTNFEVYFEDRIYELDQAGVLIAQKTTPIVTIFNREKFEVTYYLNNKVPVSITGVYQILDKE